MILGKVDIPFSFMSYLWGIVNGLFIYWCMVQVDKLFYPKEVGK
jgi:hypothetical protein